jgi:hypothetical protein
MFHQPMVTGSDRDIFFEGVRHFGREFQTFRCPYSIGLHGVTSCYFLIRPGSRHVWWWTGQTFREENFKFFRCPSSNIGLYSIRLIRSDQLLFLVNWRPKETFRTRFGRDFQNSSLTSLIRWYFWVKLKEPGVINLIGTWFGGKFEFVGPSHIVYRPKV